MERASVTRFFLGANSAQGFYSLYDGFTNPAAGAFLWVIKGGPGCGKSTLMRRVGAAAEAAGEAVEYIHCSGDPGSLDAVWLPGRKLGYVDGTAPHVQEAVYPGAASKYLDMSCLLDERALRGEKLPEIVSLNRRYKAFYAQAYALLAAGTALLPRNTPGLIGTVERERAEKRAAGFAARELRRRTRSGRSSKRFLSAFSCQGHICFTATLKTLAPQVCLLDNTLGLGHIFLDRISILAAERGYDRMLCPDPLEPEKLEALLLPEIQLAFFAGKAEQLEDAGLIPWRRLHLDGLADRRNLSEQREMLRERKRESALLLQRGMETLAEAKVLHDALEALYRPHVDFAGADALAEEHILRMFS